MRCPLCDSVSCHHTYTEMMLAMRNDQRERDKRQSRRDSDFADRLRRVREQQGADHGEG
jgi:hypothetical protein